MRAYTTAAVAILGLALLGLYASEGPQKKTVSAAAAKRSLPAPTSSAPSQCKLGEVYDGLSCVPLPKEAPRPKPKKAPRLARHMLEIPRSPGRPSSLGKFLHGVDLAPGAKVDLFAESECPRSQAIEPLLSQTGLCIPLEEATSVVVVALGKAKQATPIWSGTRGKTPLTILHYREPTEGNADARSFLLVVAGHGFSPAKLTESSVEVGAALGEVSAPPHGQKRYLHIGVYLLRARDAHPPKGEGVMALLQPSGSLPMDPRNLWALRK